MPASKPASKLLQSYLDNPASMGTALLTELVETVPVADVVNAIREMLSATTHQRTTATTVIEVPDHKSRYAAAKLFFAYALGEPIQRSVEIVQRPETEDSTLERLLSSPAARASLKAMLKDDGAAC